MMYSIRHIIKINRKIVILSAVIMTLMISGLSTAGEPEYMKLDYNTIPAVEIKVSWDSSGVLIAHDLEPLPKARRPKIRCDIQNVDRENKTITAYGIKILIQKDTQFLDPNTDFNNLKAGQRVELSCKISDNNKWLARKIKISDIKGSDKIKGNITKVSVDGNSPDTIEVEGLKIILNRKTDINEFGAFFREIEDEIFPDLKYSGYDASSNQHTLGEVTLLSAEYRQTTRSRVEHDLYEAYDTDNSETRPELRVSLNSKPQNNIDAFFQLRVRKWLSINDENLTPPSNDLDFEISQIYLVFKNIATPGLAFQIGRQDFEENREWLFDDYLDAARVYYYGKDKLLLESAVIHGVSPLKQKFETWTDYFLQASLYFDSENKIRAYLLRRWDSDELRNREPIWYGIGYNGAINNMVYPWAEYSIMRGEDKGRTLDANAYDIGLTGILKSNRFKPSLTLSQAKGSGDKTGGDDISNEFRQTGYQDNVDYLGGINSVLYYGELLDPELSNMKISTICFGIQPLTDFSIQFIYHTYQQDVPDDKFRGDLYDPPARPNSSNDDLGSETDIVLSITNIWNRISASWIIAFFEPGDAFIQPNKKATLNKFNLKIDL